MPNVSRNTILNDTRVPLVVDVDGSLVRGDLLTEGLLRLFAASPAKLLAFPFMLAAGRAPMKRWLARHGGTLPAATLVLNPAVVREMEDARKAGREVWLASGSDEWVVAPLAQDVGATGCFASDGRTNLVGGAKAALLVERFGERGFDYVGNERRDLAVWKRARRAIGVDLSLRLANQVKTLDRQARLLGGIGGGAVDVLRALRPRQWMATLLVFAPVAAAAEAGAEHYLAAAGMAAALAACASSRSLFEDLLNLPADRLDGGRRCRPLAVRQGASAGHDGGRFRAGRRGAGACLPAFAGRGSDSPVVRRPGPLPSPLAAAEAAARGLLTGPAERVPAARRPGRRARAGAVAARNAPGQLTQRKTG